MAIVPSFSLDGRDYCIATGGPHHNVAIYVWVRPKRPAALMEQVWPLVGSFLATVVTFVYLRRASQGGSTSSLFASVRREGLVYFVVVSRRRTMKSMLTNFRSSQLTLSTSASSPLASPRPAWRHLLALV